MKNEKKLCPLNAMQECKEEKCSWFKKNRYKNFECSVSILAESLSILENHGVSVY